MFIGLPPYSLVTGLHKTKHKVRWKHATDGSLWSPMGRYLPQWEVPVLGSLDQEQLCFAAFDCCRSTFPANGEAVFLFPLLNSGTGPGPGALSYPEPIFQPWCPEIQSFAFLTRSFFIYSISTKCLHSSTVVHGTNKESRWSFIQPWDKNYQMPLEMCHVTLHLLSGGKEKKKKR